MKVLQINVVVDSGSTGKVVRDIDKVLVENHIDSLICYGRKSTYNADRTYKFCTEAEALAQKILNRLGLVLMYGGNYLSTRRLIHKIQKEKPDIVHIHCINGYCVNIYRLLDYLAKTHIRTLVTHHAEFFYTANCGHSLDCIKFTNSKCCDCKLSQSSPINSHKGFPHKSWLRMFKSFHRFSPGYLQFTAVSPWVKKRSSLSPIVSDIPCTVVMNGIDTSIFYYREDKAELISAIPKINGNIIFHATASFSDRPTPKGGHYIIQLAKLMPQHTFVVASNYSDINSELPLNLIFWGRTKDQDELAKLYSIADVTVVSSLRETFSMIVAESLCCGTPVVGFEAGGPETIALADYSTFVPYGNIEALAKAVSDMLNICSDKETISKKGGELYSKERMTKNYLKTYNEFVN